MKNILLLVSLFWFYAIAAQDFKTPLQQNNYEKVTSYNQLTDFLNQLNEISNNLKVDVIGKSVEGRNIYAMLFSSSRFGEDKSKVRVMIFAQQHGNEQSGKEAAIILAQELIKPENQYLLQHVDFALIPQVNPDGSEENKRRNAAGVDLNRNHLILTQPETQALQDFFSKYLFDVTMDVHEYAPYGESWVEYGARKNSEVTVGAITNNNVAKEIYNITNNDALPFLLNFIAQKGYTSFEYCPGGPPEVDYFRRSTVDINDGRQVFGIQNTVSFIQEGLNGKDNYVDNIKRRAEGQMVGMMGLLEYVNQNHVKIFETVRLERESLTKGQNNDSIALQTVNVGTGEKLYLPMLSYTSNNDTIVAVNDYRPDIKTLYSTSKPLGYLVPASLTDVTEWAKRHKIRTVPYKKKRKQHIEQLLVGDFGIIDFEGDTVANPTIETKSFNRKIKKNEYLIIPTNQLKGNLIVLALEPKSMLGLVTYDEFKHLLKQNEAFPILRVTE